MQKQAIWYGLRVQRIKNTFKQLYVKLFFCGTISQRTMFNNSKCIEPGPTKEANSVDRGLTAGLRGAKKGEERKGVDMQFYTPHSEVAQKRRLCYLIDTSL